MSVEGKRVKPVEGKGGTVRQIGYEEEEERQSCRVVYVESVLAGASSRKKDQEEEMWPWKGADFWLVWRERER